MDRRSVRHNGGGSRRSREPEAAEDTESRRGVGSTRTVTVTNSQRVVTRRSVGGANLLNYEVDPWETSPKTDYTYSRTRSYLKQPVHENYISPNMSRQGLRRSATPQLGHEYSSGRNEYAAAASSTIARNLEVEGSYEEGATAAARGFGDGGGVTATHGASWASKQSGSSDTYMTLRSRTLTTQQESSGGNWRSDNTFAMRNLHGTDLEVEEEVSDTESTLDHRPIAIQRRSLVDQFSSFIVTVIEICWTAVTYLPRAAVSKASTLANGMSNSNMSNNTHQATKRARTTAGLSTSTTVTTSTTTCSVSTSRWRQFQKAVASVVSFLLVTLPVGLASWGAYGMISAAKLTGRSSLSAWGWIETVLKSTVTRTSRVTDAALLSRTSEPRRRCGCPCLFSFLILGPLLVLGLYYAGFCQRDDVIAVGSSAYYRVSAFLITLFARQVVTEKEAVAQTETTVVVDTGGAGKMAVDSGGSDSGEVSLLALADMERRLRDMFVVLAADQKTTAQAEQDRALSAFRSHLDRLVKMIVQRELQLQKITIKMAADDGRAYLMAEQQKQMATLLAMRNSLDALAEKANSLSEELKGVKASVSIGGRLDSQPEGAGRAELVELEEHVEKLNAELVLLQGKYDDLTTRMAKWPTQDQTTKLIRTRIHEYFVQVMGAGALLGAGSTLDGDEEGDTEAGEDGQKPSFAVWLDRHYTDHDELNRELELLAANVTKEINEKTDANNGLMANIVQAAVAAKLEQEEERRRQDGGSFGVGVIGTTGGATDGVAPCTLCDGQLSVGDVLRLIRTELGIYDADKTGKVDYALESAGGSIISVRCSQTYQLQTAQTSVFGIPLWYTYNSPRVIIQPGVHPGECWAFAGSQGYVVVQLARRIFVTEVSLEHIPKTLSPSGRIDSAPKDFGIWGLESESDLTGVPLGNFTYDDSGSPIQTFSIQRTDDSASFRFVELKVNSNYGQDSYTCLYRFRVHGQLDPDRT